MSSLKEIRELLVYFYNYDDMRNSLPRTMKSSWALCCSKVNVCRSIEPFCDLHIAKFSYAPQFLCRLGVGIQHFSKICSQVPCPRANHSSQMQPNFPTPGCTLRCQISQDWTQQRHNKNIYFIDTSVLLENIPLVKFIETTSGTWVVYFP